jgi:hypothetical protein
MVLFSLPTLLTSKTITKKSYFRKNHLHSEFSGRPGIITAGSLAAALEAAQADIADEAARTRAGFSRIPDPGSSNNQGRISADDASILKAKFPFLKDYSDEYIQTTPLDALIRAETTAFKLKEMEKGANIDDMLALNRDKLASTIIKVMAGVDNRWDQLHPARFLPGASCSAKQLWLQARELLGNAGHPALSSYDMASVGLQGCISSKGWTLIANPGSSQLRVRYFSITCCSSKVISTRDNKDSSEYSASIEELGEFKLALRALRVAMGFVHPWNKSIEALSSFFEQTDFCAVETVLLDKRASLLSGFTDFVLEENSNRWRAKESFISAGEMKEAWSSYIATRPQLLLASVKAVFPSRQQQRPSGGQGNQQRAQQQPNQGPATAAAMSLPNPYFDNICVRWNQGRCLAAPGTCTTKKGLALRHCCNFRPNPATHPHDICQGNHAACFYHR